MSALIRSARYARFLQRFSQNAERITVTKTFVTKKLKLPTNTDLTFTRTGTHGIKHQFRHYSPIAGEKSENISERNEANSQQQQQQKYGTGLQKWYSDEYPASLYWKKMDYSKLRTMYNFRDYCKVIYSALFGSGFSLQEFHGFMSLVERRDEFTDEELTLILKSVGFSNREMSRQEKLRWTEYLLNRFRKLGIHLDASHYNIVLRNYLECNIPFSPVEFLSAMEKEGVAPNGVTLARFIMAYCNNGDVKSASQILEHMRACEMPINQRVYTSLIKGNFLAGNKETAMKLFLDTKEMGFDVDQSVYHAAIYGNAMMGDLDGVKQMFAETKENYLALSDSAICSLIEKTAPKGRKDIFSFFLEELKETSTYYYTEAIETLQTLFELEQYENGYEFFRGLYDPSASLFYKSALMAHMPVEEVIQYTEKMAGEVRDANMLTYFDLAVRKHAFDQATVSLPYMEENVLMSRPHLLWPLIQYYRAMEDKNGLIKVMPFLPADPKTVSFYLSNAFNSLGVSVQEYTDIVKEHCTLSEGQKNALVLQYCLSVKGVEAALNFAKKCDKIEDIRGEGPYLLTERASAVMKPSNWQQIMEIMQKVENSWQTSVGELVQVALKRGVDKAEVKQFMLDKGVCLVEGSLKKDFKAMFSDEELQKVTRKRLEVADLKEMTLDELENLKDNFLRNSILYKINVLDKSFMAQRWSTFKKVLQETDVSTLKPVNILYKIAQFYLRESEDLPKAMQVLDKIRREHPDFTIRPLIALNILKGLFEQGKYEDAVKYLSKNSFEGTASDKLYFYNCKFMFDFEPTRENLEQANNLLAALKKSGILYFLSPAKCFSAYWQFISQMDDVDTVLESFELLRTEYNYTPTEMMSVLGNFIRSKDKNSLQTVFDKVTEHVSERMMLLSLAAAFMENGQKEKARKVLATPGLRIHPSSLTSIYNTWVETGKVQVIEEFGHLIEHLPGTVDKAEVVFMQLKAMCLQSKPDVDACIKFFETKFEEEGVYPNVQHLKFFSIFLKNHGRKTPFKHFGMNLLEDENSKVAMPPKQSQPEVREVRKDTVVKTENKKPKDQTKAKVGTPAAKTTVSEAESKDSHKPGPHVFNLEWSQVQALLESKEVIKLKTMRQILKKFPDQILAYVKEHNLPTTKKVCALAAALASGDADQAKKLKQVLFEDETRSIRPVVKMFRGITESGPQLLLFDILDTESGKAIAASFCVNILEIKKDFDALDSFVDKLKASGLSFEKIAVLNEKGRGVFTSKVTQLEQTYKEQSRNITWDLSAGWKIPSQPSSDIATSITEKPPSDVIQSTKPEVDIAVAVDSPHDVTLAVEEKTNIVKADKDETKLAKGDKKVKKAKSRVTSPEVIVDKAEVIQTESTKDNVVDKAKTLSSSSEQDIQDKAKVISDPSSKR